ncbi:cell-cycle control medial ring component-domain-containing protein [Aspergillus caelatus]|uniref:Cell-cycle control medial ring component-domain-containing protein n=2 Tax=Aspergillus subgen. Circumdati TaxID=2720871 RepID=A0A5N7A7I8_9EURO|nr:cell-cycle control medial ring component-domain-containing protein [Aspergillus caelatus]KAE8365398.1 cell-cycle control medial ring component-domain-containing protein [Aspergillus caelatus]KAE8412923.1 cell-cycle control medial ring component-domain-containing protein [Aspergillus pseudocaelatus]
MYTSGPAAAMAEANFIKSFLTSLDSRPIKLPADYVIDPERVGRVPFLLPRMPAPHPEMPKKVKQAQAPGSAKSITVNLKSARNPVLEFKLSNKPISTTSVQDLKDAVRGRVVDAQSNKIPLDKIKILYKRKPVAGKTISEILADEPEMLAGGKEVEFGVMIMGGAKVVDEDQEMVDRGASPKAALGPSGESVLETEEFWEDLEGFLAQRIKDNEEAQKLRSLFKEAWSSSR